MSGRARRFTRRANGMIHCAGHTGKVLPLAFALVAAVTFAAPAGEEAAAAEKEMVRDPATGKMVTAPEYGGTLTFGTKAEPPNVDPWQGHSGYRAMSLTMDSMATG